MADTVTRKFIMTGLGGAAGVPPSNVLWVSAGGSDATGTRGNAALPYLTFQAALTAAQNGDQIRVGPGAFVAEGLIWPVAVTTLSVVGSGMGSEGTQLTSTTDTLVPPATMTALELHDLQLISSGGNALVADGTGHAGTFMSGMYYGLMLENITLRAGGAYGLHAKFVAEMFIDNVVSGNAVWFDSSNAGFVHDLVVINSDITVTWDGAAAGAFTRFWVNLSSVSARYLLLTGQGAVQADNACRFSSIRGVAASPLTAYLTLVPSIEYHGVVTDNVDFTALSSPLPDINQAMTVNFEGAVTKLFAAACGANAVNRQAILAHGMTVRQGVTIGEKVDFYDRLANGTSLYATVVDGTITPGWCARDSGGGIGTGTTISFPFTAGYAPKTAHLIGFDPVPDLYPSALLTTGVTVAFSGGGVHSFYLTAFWG